MAHSSIAVCRWTWCSETSRTGSFLSTYAPTRVAGVGPVIEIAAGSLHTCARLADGSVECWGRDEDGQFGGTAPATCTDFRYSAVPVRCSAVPVTVAGLAGAVELSLGSNFTCARMATGATRCLGSNRLGQLGDGTTTDRTAATEVVNVGGALQLSASWEHATAILADSSVVGWGRSVGLGLGSRCDRRLSGPQ